MEKIIISICTIFSCLLISLCRAQSVPSVLESYRSFEQLSMTSPFYGLLDESMNEKIKKLEDMGFEHIHPDRFQKIKLLINLNREDIDSDHLFHLSFDKETDIYVLFLSKTYTLHKAIHLLNKMNDSWFVFHHDGKSEMVQSVDAINITQKVAISMMFWKNSQPTCSVIILNIR